MALEIRQAGNKDTALIATFVHHLLDELSGGAAPDPNTVLQHAETVLPLATVTAFIASEGTELIGIMMLNECAAIYAGGRFGEISELYVLPEFRSHGTAAKLIEAALEEGRKQAWKRLEVGAPAQPEWDRTRAFYLREGFEEVGPRLRREI